MKHKPFCLEDCLGYGGCKCAGYNKEEVMKEFEETFDSMDIKDQMDSEQEHIAMRKWLSTKLDAAFQAGREEFRESAKIAIMRANAESITNNKRSATLGEILESLEALK